MKKKYFICITSLLLLLTLLLSAIPINTLYASNYNPKHLVAQNAKEKIYLYYDKKSDDMYKGFYLKSGSKVKYFNWESLNTSSYNTSVNVINSNQIAVICTIGTGSGFHIENLYILNKKNLKVLSVENPLDVIKDNVISKIDAPNVSIKINSNIWSSTYSDIDISNFFDTVCFGNIIKYDIQDTYYSVTVPAQVTPALFIGEIKITYAWQPKSSTFIPTTINFNFEDTVIN